MYYNLEYSEEFKVLQIAILWNHIEFYYVLIMISLLSCIEYDELYSSNKKFCKLFACVFTGCLNNNVCLFIKRN